MSNSLFMLVALTAEDIALMEYTAKSYSEIDWQALKEYLQPGVMVVPDRFNEAVRNLGLALWSKAGDLEKECRRDKRIDTQIVQHMRRLASRLGNALGGPPPECEDASCCDQTFLKARAKEWVRAPRTAWEASYDASKATEESDILNAVAAPVDPDTIQMLLQLDEPDIDLIEEMIRLKSPFGIIQKDLTHFLHPGVVAVPERFAESLQALEELLLSIADDVEAGCHYDKSRMSKDDLDEIERTRRLAARLRNARSIAPLGNWCQDLICGEQMFVKVANEEWISRPRTEWEVVYEEWATAEDSHREIWEPTPASVEPHLKEEAL